MIFYTLEGSHSDGFFNGCTLLLCENGENLHCTKMLISKKTPNQWLKSSRKHLSHMFVILRTYSQYTLIPIPT